MSLYERYETNKDAEIAGVWARFPANENGTIPAFKLRRAGPSNPEYQAAFAEIERKYRLELQTETLDPATAEAVYLEAFVKSVLVTWEHVYDRNGVEIPFSHENAIKLLTDLPDLFTVLRAKAESLTTFQTKAVETDAKN